MLRRDEDDTGAEAGIKRARAMVVAETLLPLTPFDNDSVAQTSLHYSAPNHSIPRVVPETLVPFELLPDLAAPILPHHNAPIHSEFLVVNDTPVVVPATQNSQQQSLGNSGGGAVKNSDSDSDGEFAGDIPTEWAAGTCVLIVFCWVLFLDPFSSCKRKWHFYCVFRLVRSNCRYGV
jgi:hypothetical protein